MYANVEKHPEMETVISGYSVIIGTCLWICEGLVLVLTQEQWLMDGGDFVPHDR